MQTHSEYVYLLKNINTPVKLSVNFHTHLNLFIYIYIYVSIVKFVNFILNCVQYPLILTTP